MNDRNDDEQRKPSYTMSVELTPAAVEVMRCLFRHGPTYDGNIPSKSGRDQLFDLKLATRLDGYSWLTAQGVQMALSNGVQRDKERWELERHRRLVKLDEIERILRGLQATDAVGSCQSVGTGENKVRPTIEELEILLKPETDGHG